MSFVYHSAYLCNSRYMILIRIWEVLDSKHKIRECQLIKPIYNQLTSYCRRLEDKTWSVFHDCAACSFDTAREVLIPPRKNGNSYSIELEEAVPQCCSRDVSIRSIWSRTCTSCSEEIVIVAMWREGDVVVTFDLLLLLRVGVVWVQRRLPL